MNEGCCTDTMVTVSADNYFQQAISQSPGKLAGGKSVTNCPTTSPGKSNLVPAEVNDSSISSRKSFSRVAEISPISARKNISVVRTEDISCVFDGVANTGFRSVGDVVGQYSPRSGFDLYNGGNYLSDTIPGLISYVVICTFIQQKISRLVQRSNDLDGCHKVVHCWQHKASSTQKCTVTNFRDYALIARLFSDDTADLLQQVLAALDGSLADDSKILALANSLIAFCSDAEQCESLSFPGKCSVGFVASQLILWKKRFEHSDEEGRAGTKDAGKRLKTGSHFKRLIREFNAIVGPLGIAIKSRALPLRLILGRSSLANEHWLVVNENKLHGFLAKCSRLPSQREIKDQVLRHSDDATALKLFSSYERRRIEHQERQWLATAAAAVSCFLPLGKIDYAVRSVRQFREAAYRAKNLQILDEKLARISRFFGARMARLYDSDAGVLKSILEEAFWVIRAKRDRTRIKKVHATTQGGLDVAAAVVGSTASVLVPGIGGVVSDVGFGTAKLVAATSTIGIRARTDRQNQQLGRIETKVYAALKNAHNSACCDEEREEIVSLARALFDLTKVQVLLLFKRSDTNDLVTAKDLIRLRFNNTPIDEVDEGAGINGAQMAMA